MICIWIQAFNFVELLASYNAVRTDVVEHVFKYIKIYVAKKSQIKYVQRLPFKQAINLQETNLIKWYHHEIYNVAINKVALAW